MVQVLGIFVFGWLDNGNFLKETAEVYWHDTDTWMLIFFFFFKNKIQKIKLKRKINNMSWQVSDVNLIACTHRKAACSCLPLFPKKWKSNLVMLCFLCCVAVIKGVYGVDRPFLFLIRETSRFIKSSFRTS